MMLSSMRSKRSSPPLLYEIIFVVFAVIMFITALTSRKAEAGAIGTLLASVVLAVTTIINPRQRGSTPIALCIKDTSGKLRRIPLDSIPDELRKQLQERIPWFLEILEEVRRIQSEKKSENSIYTEILLSVL